jgi:hypothetical protein
VKFSEPWADNQRPENPHTGSEGMSGSNTG